MTVVELPAKGDAKGQGAGRSRLVAALDIGSTKISCLIGEAVSQNRRTADGKEASALRILGFGYQASRGTRNGAIVDLDQAERAIRLAVDAAERMAKRTITPVYVNVAGGRPQSTCLFRDRRDRNRPGHGEAMSRRRHAQRSPQGHQTGRRTLHAAPAQFQLDDARGITAPLGMFGKLLTVELNVVSAEPAALRNLALVIERCHLAVADYVVAPYAAAKSVLAEDEIKLGVTLIDMGGATTGIAVFHDGQLVFADVIPVGGQHITNDIARGLSTTIAHAERMKTLWGSAMASVVDEREMVAVPLLGERGVDTVHHVPKSMLTGIIRPRLEEIFEMVRERLDAGELRQAGRQPRRADRRRQPAHRRARDRRPMAQPADQAGCALAHTRHAGSRPLASLRDGHGPPELRAQARYPSCGGSRPPSDGGASDGLFAPRRQVDRRQFLKTNAVSRRAL